MKASPISCAVPMVRALLDGRKTQTRRVLDGCATEPPAYVEGGVITALDEHDRPYRWPHTHAVGDLLWVRETWADVLGIIYRADYPENDPAYRPQKGWHQPIFMPRVASRLTLVVTDVRVQRLQDIRAAECRAEGAITEEWDEWREDVSSIGMPEGSRVEDERDVFERLWNSINGADAWASNPWVAAYTFDVHRMNVDAYLAGQAEAA